MGSISFLVRTYETQFYVAVQEKKPKPHLIMNLDSK